MLTLKVNDKLVTFEFKNLYTKEIIHSESFDHKGAKIIAEDILLFVKQFEELEKV